MTAAAGGLDAAVARRQWDAAALRLLLGTLEALAEAGPETRDELIELLTRERS